MLPVMEQRIVSHHHMSRRRNGELLARVRVRFVKIRPRSADRHPDAVAAVEDLAHPSDVEGHAVYLAGFEQRRLFETISVARPADGVGKHDRPAVRIDVAYTHDE